MKHVIIYYPFEDAAGDHFIRTTQTSWERTSASKGKLAIFSSRQDSGAVLNYFMANLTGNDMIYIIGHCSAGSSEMQSHDHATNISVSDLADRLIASGLQTTFSGKIKLYGCSTGSTWTLNLLITSLVWDSFSQLFADEMAGRGYVHCRYFGYTKNIRTAYDSLNGELHKSADTPQGLVSARSTRLEIFPRVEMPLQGIVIE